MKKIVFILIFLVYGMAFAMTQQQPTEESKISKIASTFEKQLEDDKSSESDTLVFMFSLARWGFFSEKQQSFWTSLSEFAEACKEYGEIKKDYAIWNNKFYD